MQNFIGTKIISAKPMTLLDAKELLNRDIGYYGLETDDGYLVEYPDGYQSWSPGYAFEPAYRLCTGMSFGLAVEALKLGKKVCRAGWNGNGMWLVYVDGDVYEVARDVLISIEAPDRKNSNFLPWIGMKTADNKFVPWVASQTDVLADDWMLVE